MSIFKFLTSFRQKIYELFLRNFEKTLKKNIPKMVV